MYKICKYIAVYSASNCYIKYTDSICIDIYSPISIMLTIIIRSRISLYICRYIIHLHCLDMAVIASRGEYTEEINNM